MLVINEDLLKKEKRLYSFITKNRSCIHSNIKMQNNFKEILLKYMNKLANQSYSLPKEEQKNSIKLLSKFKACIDLCNQNIKYLKEILEVTKVSDIIDNKLETATKIDNTYIRLMTKVTTNTLEIQNFLSTVPKYINFDVTNVIDENELGSQFKSQAKKYEESDEDDNDPNPFLSKISKILS